MESYYDQCMLGEIRSPLICLLPELIMLNIENESNIWGIVRRKRICNICFKKKWCRRWNSKFILASTKYFKIAWSIGQGTKLFDESENKIQKYIQKIKFDHPLNNVAFRWFKYFWFFRINDVNIKNIIP
jgi:hypothetical protein